MAYVGTPSDTAPSTSHTVTSDIPLAHWALRLAIAASFLFHGLMKFPDLAGGAENFGLSVPIYTLVAIGEVLVPLALIGGGLLHNKLGDLMTRLGGIGAMIILAGAIVLVHWGQWSFAPSESHPMGGMEFQVSLLLIGLYLTLRGNRA